MLRHLAACLAVLILTTSLAQAQRVTLEGATLVLGLGPELGPPCHPAIQTCRLCRLRDGGACEVGTRRARQRCNCASPWGLVHGYTE